jgi:lantibiotic modifying enzyme
MKQGGFMARREAPDSRHPSGWSPLLTGSLAAQAQEALEAILMGLPPDYSEPGLAGGTCSAALFFAYLDQARPGEGWDTRSSAYLSRAIDQLMEEVSGPTLYSGFTGIAWPLDHLQNRASELATEDPNQEIDAALLDHLAMGPWRGQYDLITGLVGYGLYGLDRANRPSGRRILESVIQHLDETKSESEAGLTWHTAPELLPAWQRELNPQGYVNLGLAHGIPGAIALLSQAWAAGIHSDRAMAMLEGSVAWLLAHQNQEGIGSCFPAVIPTGASRESGPSRVAWCYGDLGLSVALFWAARTIGRRDWESEALAIARGAAAREQGLRGVRDPGLCHGSAGNAHLFNRLWQATGDAVFQQAAIDGIKETLAFRAPDRGIGGFQAWLPGKSDEEPSWRDSPGLLEGSAGIGLALISALYPIPPDWDRMLLVSVPPIGDEKFLISG